MPAAVAASVKVLHRGIPEQVLLSKRVVQVHVGGIAVRAVLYGRRVVSMKLAPLQALDVLPDDVFPNMIARSNSNFSSDNSTERDPGDGL